MPNQTILTQVWWRAVTLESAIGREEAEDVQLLLLSRCVARDGNRAIKSLARYFKKDGAGVVEEVDDADKYVWWELKNVRKPSGAIL